MNGLLRRTNPNDEPDSEKNIHPAHPVLPAFYFAALPADLSVSAILLIIYDTGHSRMGPIERHLAGHQTHRPLSPLE